MRDHEGDDREGAQADARDECRPGRPRRARRARRRVGLTLEPGQELGPSAWLEITQERIDAFAECTDDRQAIHVDPDFAATGPFGTTVAHGLLTLSLIVPLWSEVSEPHDGTTINYGLNKVRFPAPVPSGSRIRARFLVESVEPVAGGTQGTIAATVEREGHDKPVCVAELVLRFLG